MNTQNIQNELIKDEVINQELLDYSVDRSYIESHFNELSLIVIIISILFFRFNKNILKYLLNVILDVVLEVLVVFLYLKIFVIIEKFSLIGNGVFLETRDYVILFIISSIILFLIIEILSGLLTDKVSKYLGVNNLDRFSSKEDIFLVIGLMSLFVAIFSSIFLVIKIISLNKYFKYGGKINSFNNAIFKELLKFSLLILLFNLFWYFIMFLKNPTF